MIDPDTVLKIGGAVLIVVIILVGILVSERRVEPYNWAALRTQADLDAATADVQALITTRWDW